MLTPYAPYPTSWSPPLPPAPPRISGTAMPGGVFLSTGTTSTASALSLLLTGFTIVSVGILALAPTFVIAWVTDQFTGLSLAPLVLRVGEPADPLIGTACHIAVNLLTFLVFLLILRLSSLSGYHAAEHMTVHAIEEYGIFGWEPHVPHMPRAHARCGSNILAGILPTLLIAFPLFSAGYWLPALLVVAAGWRFRQRVGHYIQQTFTTKPPGPHHLAAGIAAGRKLLANWLRNPNPRLTLAQQLWVRGVPQMVAGVLCALYTLGTLVDHLHIWLDW